MQSRRRSIRCYINGLISHCALLILINIGILCGTVACGRSVQPPAYFHFVNESKSNVELIIEVDPNVYVGQQFLYYWYLSAEREPLDSFDMDGEVQFIIPEAETLVISHGVSQLILYRRYYKKFTLKKDGLIWSLSLEELLQRAKCETTWRHRYICRYTISE